MPSPRLQQKRPVASYHYSHTRVGEATGSHARALRHLARTTSSNAGHPLVPALRSDLTRPPDYYVELAKRLSRLLPLLAHASGGSNRLERVRP